MRTRVAGTEQADLAPAFEDSGNAMLRRRRVTELAGVAVALGGFATTQGVWFFRADLPAVVGNTAKTSLLVYAPITIIAALVSWAAFRAVASRWYATLAGIRFSLDTLAVASAAYILVEPVRSHAASLIILPVLSAGVRFGLRAALATWGALALAFLPIATGAAPAGGGASAGGGQAMVGYLIAVTGGFFAAWITGLQTRAMNGHLAVIESAREELQYQASHDALTGLANRSALYATDLSGAGALLVIDLNGFKAVNDNHGHASGDAVLCTVALRLRACVAEEDLVVRVGGDEFVIVLPGADAARAEGVAGAVRAELGRPIQVDGIDGKVLAVGGSVGVALNEGSGVWPIDAMAAEADSRMYREKAAHHGARTGARTGNEPMRAPAVSFR